MGQPIAQLQNQKLKCLGPLFPFRRHGQSGQQISDLLPGIAGIADDIAIVRSMHTDQINHDPAHTVMNTGTSISGRPSMGAWVTYGLGSMSEDLPGIRGADQRGRPQSAADLPPVSGEPAFCRAVSIRAFSFSRRATRCTTSGPRPA